MIVNTLCIFSCKACAKSIETEAEVTKIKMNDEQNAFIKSVL